MLQLPCLELHTLYTRHLLLKELTINDVSLYILSLLFQYKKQEAFDVYFQNDDNEHMIKKALPLLLELEDRFINGIVLYRIAYCLDDNDKYHQSINILKSQKTLSPQELFYMAGMYYHGLGTKKNINEAIKLYKLSGDGGNLNGYVNLGAVYRDCRNDELAMMYFEKGIKLEHGKCNLAYMLESKDIKRSHQLYIESANMGNQYALQRCKDLNLKI